MKRQQLLLLLLVFAQSAIAFDGGGFEIEEEPELTTDQFKTKNFPTIQNFTNPAWIFK